MGGYGALRIGMKRPDVFSVLYLMSSCCLNATINPRAEQMTTAAGVTTREQAEEEAKKPGFGVSVTLASAAAWSPNPDNPPLFFDLPIKDGALQPDVIAKWAANAPLAMLPQYVTNLKKYSAVAIEVGTKDNLLRSNKHLEEMLTSYGVVHTYEEYEGDHTNRVFERVEKNLLPYFSKELSFGTKRSTH